MTLLDLGCGERKREGYLGVDKIELPGIDIVCDFEKELPFPDDYVDGIYSNFLFEHIENKIQFFQELNRICKKGAIIEFRVPFFQSVTQYKDPTHKSMFMPEMMPYFSNTKWYGSDYGINTNFKLLSVEYFYLPPFDKLLMRRFFLFRPIVNVFLKIARTYLWNVVHSITMKLEVVK